MRRLDEERRARCPTDPPGGCLDVYSCDWCWDLYAEEGCRLRDEQQARDEMTPNAEAENSGADRLYNPTTGMITYVCTNDPPGSCAGIQLLHCATCNEQQGSTTPGTTSTEMNVSRSNCAECRQGGSCVGVAEGGPCSYAGTCACLEACSCSNIGNWIAHTYAGQPELARAAREAAARERAAREAGRNAERQGICICPRAM